MNREAERKKLRDTLSWIRYKLFPSDEATTEFIIDSLLRDGIIAPPCPIGTTIYMIVEKRAKSTLEYFKFIKITKLTYYNLERVLEQFGKTVFLTKEEAKNALKGVLRNDRASGFYI